MKELYTWVPWFTELAKRIADGTESDLAQRARRLPWKADGSTSKLLEYGDSNIDPFSFLYTLAANCTIRQRMRLCESVHREFALSTPHPEDSDDAFIFPQGYLGNTLFHSGGHGNPDLLWRLFRSASQGIASVDPDDFQGALDIGQVGLKKLTQALFLANPNELLPLDDSTTKLLPDPSTKVESWTDYRAALDEIRGSFPSCALYEANLIAYLLYSGTFSTIGQNVFQISANVYNDGQDRWGEFRDENAVWTGGPGNIAWDEFEQEAKPSIPYPLQNPVPGDLILVRYAGQGRAIGLVYRNDYANNLSSEARLHVVWLNRLSVSHLLSSPRGLGFSQAHEIAERFFANDAYRPTRTLLDRLGYGGETVNGLTREDVLRVINEFDELGRDAFIEKYGYDKSRTYWLIHETGRYERYDMKAIWAAAHLEPDAQLPAGWPVDKYNHPPYVQRELEPLGFTIVHDKTATTDAPLNQILYGPPGTGKTFRTTNLAVSIVDGSNGDGEHDAIRRRFNELRFDPEKGTGNIALVTFHQNYAYEDFVEGIRPVLGEEELRYELRDGIFRRIAQAAMDRPEERFVLIIDEINRGNIAKIFGELITLIEDSRRSGHSDETTAKLQYSHDDFTVPANLYLIGTMNTADRSIQLLDTALRRRFKFLECMPDPKHEKIPTDIDGVNCQQLLQTLNERIALLLDREHQIGHTYFLDIDNLDKLADVFRRSVFPLLKEYFFDDWSKIRAVLNNNGFVIEHKPKQSVLGPLANLLDEDRKAYRLADDEQWTRPEPYRAIYGSESGSTNSE